MVIHSLLTQCGVLFDIAANCNYIEEHRAAGEGDKWYYDIYKDGEVTRVFDPLEAVMSEDK